MASANTNDDFSRAVGHQLQPMIPRTLSVSAAVTAETDSAIEAEGKGTAKDRIRARIEAMKKEKGKCINL